MNDNDIKKCMKNGYCWSSCGDKPEMTPTHDYTRGQLKAFEGLHATKAAAQLAISTRRQDERVAKRKAYAAQAALDKAKAVESHETPVGETQAKEVVTDETQTPKPTTVRGWLETIPDPAIREAAIRQCALPYKTCYVLCDAIASMRDWAHTEEGVDFWDNCYFAAKHNDSWPTYPPKEKQVKDGWTDEEIEKAAFKTKEWTDIPQVVTKRNTDDSVTHPKHYTSHPSGIECIQVTEHMNFCRGNAVKYVWRAGEKGDEIEDLKKARWYLDREIARLEKAKEQND